MPGLTLPRLAARPIGKLGHLLARWHRNAVTRRALAALPPERLADLGLTPEMAAQEAHKWFWCR